MSRFSRDYKPTNHTDAFASTFPTVSRTPRDPEIMLMQQSNQQENGKSKLFHEMPCNSSPLSNPPPESLSGADIAKLPLLLEKVIADSLRGYLYQNAIFYAERLYDLVPDYRSLHILADCYVQSGDVDTACRLLRSYYPFFEVHVNRPSSAGPLPVQRSTFRGDGGGGNPSASAAPAAGSPPQHRFSFMIPGRGHIGSSKATPLDSRTALQHDSDGQPILLHLPVDIQPRWDCQYLFGVCCCRTQCYAEAGKVLEELLRISTRFLESSEQWQGRGKGAAQEAEESGLPAHGLSANAWGGASRVSALPPSGYHAIQQHLPGLRYWLGVSAKHRCLDHAPGLFKRAAEANPFLFCAFEEYIKTVLKPHEACLTVFSEGHEEVAQEDVEVPVGTREATGSESQQRRTGDGLFSYGRGATHILKKFLMPFATVTYHLGVYNCAATQRYIHDFPQNLAPADTSAWLLTQHALAFFHDGDMQVSANIFQTLLKAVPWRLNDAALVLYSTALWQLKAESTLAALAQTLMEQLPFSAITLCIVANTYSLAKEPRQALEMLERAILVDPFMAYAYNLCGYELLYLNQKNEAAEAFKNAIYRDRHLYVAYAGLGEQYARDGNIIWAREYFQKAILINPLPAVLNRYAATFHRHSAAREDLEKAYTLYTEAITRHSRNLMAQHQRADVLLLLGRMDEAHAQLLELIRTYPNEAMLYISLAKCVQLMGMPDKAVMYYQKAMTIDPRQEGYVKRCIENLVSETSDHV
ncbi:unnamed protein product [Phytomonas sp. EM1]|nr:unnamed protein product [Phytomonas sp. EM1]|eukprot:CCW65821.1 unnamed protein product [Phytomonas sp. isolate EM1]